MRRAPGGEGGRGRSVASELEGEDPAEAEVVAVGVQAEAGGDGEPRAVEDSGLEGKGDRDGRSGPGLDLQLLAGRAVDRLHRPEGLGAEPEGRVELPGGAGRP